MHGLGLVRPVTALVHDGQRSIEPFGIGPGPFHAARVGRDNNDFVFVKLAQAVQHDRHGEKIVHRAVEKALNLSGMQVNGDHALGPGHTDEIRHHLGADGRARADFAVLAGIGVIGDHRRDASGAGGQVGWTTKTSSPRTLSPISMRSSPSLNVVASVGVS